MNVNKNYKKGIRNKIITLALMCGCLPMKRLRLLNTNHRTLLAKLRDMQEEGVLDEIHIKDKWIFTLTTGGKNMPELEAVFSPTLIKQYKDYAQKDESKVRSRSETKDGKLDSVRILNNVTTIFFYYGIGFQTITDEKPTLFHDDLTGLPNTYYTSREVKGYKNLEGDREKNNTVETTRLSGLSATHGGNYIVFQMGKSLIDFTEKGEGKAKIYVEQMLFEKRLGPLTGSILLSDKENALGLILEPPSKRAENRLKGIFNVYENIYFLTNDLQGQKMMEVMAIKDWEDIIYGATLSKEMRAGRSTTSIDCDGYKDGKHYMVYCIPNIARLRRFYGAAKLMRNKERYIVYCFRHQENLLQEILGDYCLVQSADFEELYRYMKGKAL